MEVNDELWMVWSWVEPVLWRRWVPAVQVPGYRCAVRAPGTKGNKIVSRVIGWHEYFSGPVPWSAVPRSS